MSKLINIVVWEKDGWILTRLADALVSGLTNARKVFNNEHDKLNEPNCINYYINDWNFQKKTKNTDIVFFDHPKGHVEKKRIKPDHAIAMTPQYQTILQRIGLSCDLVIQPVDTEKYCPKLILAFVGRFVGAVDYGDRKGRDLLQKVKNIPYVEVKETLGKIPEEELPDFYRSCDAVIVPSKVEGGPMCLTEGLACGLPVIIPKDVGVAELFEEGIISYKNSDFCSLEKVLNKLYLEKKKRADLVKQYTWKYWVQQHEEIFSRFRSPQKNKSKPKAKVCLYTTMIGKYGEQIGRYSVPLMQQWAQNNGWDFHIFTEQGSHKTPSWVRVDAFRHMKDNLYEKGVYLDLDIIVNPNCGTIIRSGSSWDILAYNHASDENWKKEESVDHLEKYCKHIKEQLPSSYTGKVYFNAGVMVMDKKCYGFSVPLEKEVVFGCQDQEALNLAVAKKELRWAPLHKKWNYGHLKEKDISGIFNKANIVHCHLPSLAPCQLAGRVQLMKKVREEYHNWIRSKTQSKGR